MEEFDEESKESAIWCFLFSWILFGNESRFHSISFHFITTWMFACIDISIVVVVVIAVDSSYPFLIKKGQFQSIGIVFWHQWSIPGPPLLALDGWIDWLIDWPIKGTSLLPTTNQMSDSHQSPSDTYFLLVVGRCWRRCLLTYSSSLSLFSHSGEKKEYLSRWCFLQKFWLGSVGTLDTHSCTEAKFRLGVKVRNLAGRAG